MRRAVDAGAVSGDGPVGAVSGVRAVRAVSGVPAVRAVRAATAFGWAAAVLGLLLSLGLHWRLREMAFDDTYIHLRIARNLLRTGNAWFNPGERVMATSSPVWTLLLAGLRVPEHPAMLPLVEALLLWISAVLAFRVVRKSLPAELPWPHFPVVATVASAATITFLLPSSIGQMETPLAIALLLAAWMAALREESFAGRWMALPLLALAAATRLEFVPVLFLAACAALFGQRRRALAGVVPAMLIAAAAAAWTFLQFGVLLPNSVRAKQVTYSFTLRQAAHQFYASRLRDEVFLALLGCLLAIAIGDALRPAGRDGMEAAEAGKAGRAGAGRAQRFGLLAMLTALLLVANYLLHHAVIFDWYRPLVLVPLALGVAVTGACAGGPLPVRRVAGLMSALALLFAMLEPLRQAWKFAGAAIAPTAARESRVDGGDSARVRGYLEMGETLRRLCPGSRLLTPEIGALGWAFDGYVYDSFGIASPEALRYQPLPPPYPRGGTPAGYVMAVLPDVMVGYRVLDLAAARFTCGDGPV